MFQADGNYILNFLRGLTLYPTAKIYCSITVLANKFNALDKVIRLLSLILVWRTPSLRTQLWPEYSPSLQPSFLDQEQRDTETAIRLPGDIQRQKQRKFVSPAYFLNSSFCTQIIRSLMTCNFHRISLHRHSSLEM